MHDPLAVSSVAKYPSEVNLGDGDPFGDAWMEAEIKSRGYADKRGRSAVNGQFVTRAELIRKPRETIAETVKRR